MDVVSGDLKWETNVSSWDDSAACELDSNPVLDDTQGILYLFSVPMHSVIAVDALNGTVLWTLVPSVYLQLHLTDERY